MYSLRKTDQLLFDGGEDALENEWTFVTESGERVVISVNSLVHHPLNRLKEHLSEGDFLQLIDELKAQQNGGISGNYCNPNGLELYWLMRVLNGQETFVIVAFGEVNPGRYRLVVEGEIFIIE